MDAALGYTIVGQAQRELGLWNEAETSIKSALVVHDKANFLEEAAYDWYLIASVRSRAANYEAALEALDNALALDRRAENSYGLATDWNARGTVLEKAGRSSEAQAAYKRSQDIYRSIGFGTELVP